MAPMDTIWLFTVLMYVTVGRHFMAIHLPSQPIGVLVVLVTPVKVSIKAGNSSSYSLNSW